MLQQFPDRCTDPEAAEEGTAAHWVAAETLAGRPPAEGFLAPNGVEVSEEMLDGAELYAEEILSAVGGAPLAIEQPVACPSVHPHCWGTPDAYARPAPSILYVWDYKFGYGLVDPWENWQGVCYISGLLDQNGVDGLADQHTRVVFTIVQPRAYHRDGPVRQWSCMASDLRPLINRLHVAAHDESGRLAVGPHCEHCPGRHACPALQYASYRYADMTLQDSPPVEMQPAAAALELRLLERAADGLAARITGLQEQVRALLRSGAQVPGYRLEQQSGREAWTADVAAVFALGDMLGVDLRKPAKAITPRQARKAGIPAEVVTAMAARPPGVLKLLPDDGSIARRVFNSAIDGSNNKY